MRPKRPDEALAKPARHVLDPVGRDRERVVESVADRGPRVEAGSQEDEEAAAVDRADAPAEGVRDELLVAVEDDDLAGSAE